MCARRSASGSVSGVFVGASGDASGCGAAGFFWLSGMAGWCWNDPVCWLVDVNLLCCKWFVRELEDCGSCP